MPTSASSSRAQLPHPSTEASPLLSPSPSAASEGTLGTTTTEATTTETTHTDYIPSPRYAAWCQQHRASLTSLWLCLSLVPLLSAAFFVALGVYRNAQTDASVRHPAGAAPRAGLAFLVVGDWGREGRHGQRAVSRAMARVARSVGPRFVISAGDNFYDAGVDSVDDAQWEKSFERVYADPALSNVAWWSTLGNHDHLGKIDAQVRYSGQSRRWTMPAPFYTFTSVGSGDPARADSVADVQFIFLDSTPYIHDGYGKAARKLNKQKPAEQTEWLEKTLETSVAPHIIVVIHHALYTMSTTGHLGAPELRAHIEPLLLRHRARVLAVISGHEHALMHTQPYGGRGVWAGAADTVPPENATEALRRNKRHAGGSQEKAGFSWARTSSEGKTPPRAPAVSGTCDHFISGAGSAIDKISLPPKDKAGVWETCCAVLSPDAPETKPRGLFARSTHGFYVFTITRDEFYADAYDGKGKIIYQYSKPI